MPRLSLYDEIARAVYVDATLREPFGVKEIRRLVPGLLQSRYYQFLAANCVAGAVAPTPMFERVGRGKYRLTSHCEPTGAPAGGSSSMADQPDQTRRPAV